MPACAVPAEASLGARCPGVLLPSAVRGSPEQIGSSQIDQFVATAIQERHVSGEDQDRDTRLVHRGLHRNLEKAKNLSGMRDDFAEVAAVGEEPFRVGFLEVPAAELAARYVRGDRQDGNAASMTIIQAVDQVQVTRA